MFAYKNPQLLKGAVTTLSENCAFFVHIDRKSSIDQFSYQSRERAFFASGACLYVGPSGIDAIPLLLIHQVLGKPEHYDYFVLLSGSEPPIGTVTLNPERDSVVRTASRAMNQQLLAA